MNYDKNDRFALNGQRLMQIAPHEYRYELEQWSKITTTGSDPANPDSWTEHLPDGTTRLFGVTTVRRRVRFFVAIIMIIYSCFDNVGFEHQSTGSTKNPCLGRLRTFRSVLQLCQLPVH